MTVVFDLGRVLLDFDFGITARNLASHSRWNGEEFRRQIDQTPLLHDLEGGRITPREFHQRLVAESGLTLDYESFVDPFSDMFTPISEMIDFHARLKTAGIPTYICSNTSSIVEGFIRRKYPFFNGFDGYIFSFAVKSMKPDARIYEEVERLTGRQGGDVIFIDDRKENVDAGAARGWRTVWHQNPARSIQMVERWLD